MKRLFISFLGFYYVLTMVSCDAIRVVRVTNVSPNPIEIITDFPHQTMAIKDSNGLYREKIIWENDINTIRKRHDKVLIDTISDDLIIRLQPFQYLDISGHIGSAFGKINKWDLNHSRMSIYTLSDTIVAKNKNEILDLFDNQKTKYIRKLDRKRIENDNKYWKNIVIRK